MLRLVDSETRLRAHVGDDDELRQRALGNGFSGQSSATDAYVGI